MSYKDNLLPIIREVREILMPQYGLASILNKKTVNATDVVTELDHKVENFLSRKLQEVYPDIGFVGEEFGGDRDANMFWLVDPIDGTGHYVRGMPFCTTMLALIKDGEVVFSAIYDFVLDNMYWAEKGKGAFMNDTPIHVSDREAIDSYLSWETHLAEKDANLPKFVSLTKKFHMFKTLSSGWEFVMIATGKIEARVAFQPWGKDYDFAPGSLLVTEAGGIIRNINSETYDYRNLDYICATPKTFPVIEKIFHDYK